MERDSPTSGARAAAGNSDDARRGRAMRRRAVIALRKALGFLLSVNFAVFWLTPIVVQGQMFKRFLHRALRPIYNVVDQSTTLREFAFKHVYREPSRVDYFATALFFLSSVVISLTLVFWWQIAHGSLPWWVVGIYYFLWVGFGGRGMGAAYTFAHREGHAGGHFYRPRIQRTAGNVFENRVGLFYGNVPHNFSTSHVLLHHRLNAGKGDPFYMWDLDRTKFGDLMLYHWRTFVYMTGWSSLVAFDRHRDIPAMDRGFRQLLGGVALYWLVMPLLLAAVLLATGSSVVSALVFLLFIYFQPLLGMASFITILNVGFHGFIEFDRDGGLVPCVCSTTIIDGADDFFGENDHLAHHDFGRVSHDRLAVHQRSQRSLWARRRASVFQNLSVFELSTYVMLRRFRTLAEKHYLDFAGDASVDGIEELLRTRASRREMDYADYEYNYLPNLKSTTEELVRRGVCSNANQALLYQARQRMTVTPPAPAEVPG